METVDERTGQKVEKTIIAINTSEDFARLRGLWSQMPMIPKVTRVEESPTVRFPSSTIRVLLNGEESGGSVSVFYQEVEPGFGAPPHHQPNEEEYFFILEGEMEMTIGNQTIHAIPGTFAFAPRNATHAFKNNGKRSVDLLRGTRRVATSGRSKLGSGWLKKGLGTPRSGERSWWLTTQSFMSPRRYSELTAESIKFGLANSAQRGVRLGKRHR